MKIIDVEKMVDEALSIRAFARKKAPVIRAELGIDITDKQVEDTILNLTRSKHKYYKEGSMRALVMKWLKDKKYVKESA